VLSRLATTQLSDETQKAILARPELAREEGGEVYAVVLDAYHHGFRVVFITLAVLAVIAFITAFCLMHQRTLDREDDEKRRQEGKEFVAQLEKKGVWATSDPEKAVDAKKEMI
jgi:hypothetical protein